MAHSSTKKKEEELKKAKFEIQTFAAVSKDVDDEWWRKFDELYQQIQKDLGVKDVLKLERGQEVAPTSGAVIAKTNTTKKKKEVVDKQPAPEEDGSNLGMIVLAVLLFGGGGAGVFFMFKNQGRHRRVSYAPATAPVLPPSRPATAKTKTADPKQLQARRAAAKQAQLKKQAQAKQAAKPKATRPNPQKRPRPKPE